MKKVLVIVLAVCLISVIGIEVIPNNPVYAYIPGGGGVGGN